MLDLAADRDAIRDLLARYTYNGDRGQIETLAACFTETGVLEFLGKTPCGPAAIRATLAAGERDPRLGFVRHHITNPLIDVKGDAATARSYFTVHTDTGPDHSGTYDDKLIRSAEGWLLSYRRVRIDWQASGSLYPPMTTR